MCPGCTDGAQFQRAALFELGERGMNEIQRGLDRLWDGITLTLRLKQKLDFLRRMHLPHTVTAYRYRNRYDWFRDRIIQAFDTDDEKDIGQRERIEEFRMVWRRMYAMNEELSKLVVEGGDPVIPESVRRRALAQPEDDCIPLGGMTKAARK